MFKEKLAQYNIILASGSPRRKQFFIDLDLNFTVIIKEVDEQYDNALKAHQITNYLAKLKANQFINLQQNDIVIASDTIVWFDNKALGKPINYDDAVIMLQKLSNNVHEVYTSVCIKTSQKTTCFYEKTKVTFGYLSDENIHYYLTKYQPFDKAGSYGIQDWIGLIGITKIEGSYANVVGLPTQKLFNYLLNNF